MLRKAFGHGIQPSDGRLLHDLIVEKRYRRALDIGTAHGYAALWFALAMSRTGGQVITIEIDLATAAQARENFEKSGLAIDLRVNDALIEIPALAGDFDFVFLDPGAPINTKLLALLRDRLLPGAAVAAHNAYTFKLAQPGFLEAVRKDPGLRTEVVPTASGGISISFRTLQPS
jgi:predicted O-methyltransferase YrrM